MPTFNYSLISGRNQAPLELYAVQGEAGVRTFALSLRYQNGQTGVGASSTAYAYVVKNDGTVAVMDCQVAAGVVTFTLSLQACTCPGYNKVFVQVLSEQAESRWDNMVLFVEPCDIENAVASTDDLGPLANLITDPDYLNSVIDAYETATEQVEALLGQMTPKGEYDPNTTYSKLNIVSYEGASYVANGPTRGNPPTDIQHWTMLSQRGEQGKQGVQGPQGPRGEQGPAGPQGPPGETGPQGPQGEKGDTGTGLDILGTYDNLEALQSAVTQPQQGNMYNVGTTAPYTVYMWDTTNGGEWISQGQLQGAKGETGPQGPQGEPGPQGPQGPQGEQGPQGQQGGPGQAATIQVGQVTTGKPGSQATVTNSGTENAAVLNFVIPQGATGQAGLTAAQVLALVYPVGSIYTSVNNINPGTFMAGTTWEAFAPGRTLFGVDTNFNDFNTVGKTGGNRSISTAHTHQTQSHTLTVAEMPSHGHDIGHSHSMNHTHGDTFSVASGGAHTHGVVYGTNNEIISFNTGGNSRHLEFDGSNGYNNPSEIHTSSAGAHVHTLNGSVSQYTGRTGPYDSPSGYAGSGYGHDHGDTLEGGYMYDIIPPYITVYFWKRTA